MTEVGGTTAPRALISFNQRYYSTHAKRLVNTLYKYLPPERIDVLESQMIRLTQPGELNDPVESQARFVETRSWEEFVDTTRDLFSEIENPDRFPDLLDRLDPQHRPIAQQLILGGVWDLTTVILSLSASRSVEAMWSHYADSHRGFVIGFDARSKYFSRTDRLQILGAVKYKKYLRPVAYLEAMDINSLAFTKSSTWAYEREWRLVKSIANNRRFLSGACSKTKTGYDLWLERLPAASFSSVTIGFKAHTELQLRIRNALSRDQFRHIKLYQAVFNKAGRLFFRKLQRVVGRESHQV